MYFRRWCKWCASRWYWPRNCLKFVQNTITLHLNHDILQNFVMMTSSLQWIQGIWKIPRSKYLRLWNLCSKPNSTMSFSTSLLMISFKGLNLIFYIWLFNTTIKVIVGEKKANLNKTLLLLLGIWSKKYGINIWSTILVHFTMFAPTKSTITLVLTFWVHMHTLFIIKKNNPLFLDDHKHPPNHVYCWE